MSKKIISLFLFGLIITLLSLIAVIFWTSNKGDFSSSNIDQNSPKKIALERLYETLYKLGISANSKEVLVGKSGWLYGSQVSKETIILDKKKYENTYITDAQNINSSIVEWQRYAEKSGIKQLAILIIPDKRSLYPEFLPSWATFDSRKPINALIDTSNSSLFIDSFETLNKAKVSNDVFYRTDSTLSAAGAIASFQLLSSELKKTAPEIRWPQESSYRLKIENEVYRGALAQKIKSPLSAVEPIQKIHFQYQIPVTEFNTINLSNSITSRDKKQKNLNESATIYTQPALNNKKVLWVRDGLSAEMLPLMTATFSQVMDFPWRRDFFASEKLMAIVKQWSPDYVIFTLNEREINSDAFERYPASEIFDSTGLFKDNIIIGIESINNLKNSGVGKFRINGVDPFIVFNLKNPIDTGNISKLYINISCQNQKNIMTVPLELYWQPIGKAFSEENSSRFIAKTDGYTLDLNSIPKWMSSLPIDKVRLDINSTNCTEFVLNKVFLGKLN